MSKMFLILLAVPAAVVAWVVVRRRTERRAAEARAAQLREARRKQLATVSANLRGAGDVHGREPPRRAAGPARADRPRSP